MLNKKSERYGGENFQVRSIIFEVVYVVYGYEAPNNFMNTIFIVSCKFFGT